MKNKNNGYKKTVLAIDDMPDILHSINTCLKPEYNVYTLTSADQALKFLQTCVPDIIILDILMPEMNGYTLLQIIRESKEHMMIPVLFLTSDATVNNVVKANYLGALGFIVKPVNKEVLLAKIKTSLQ